MGFGEDYAVEGGGEFRCGADRDVEGLCELTRDLFCARSDWLRASLADCTRVEGALSRHSLVPSTLNTCA